MQKLVLTMLAVFALASAAPAQAQEEAAQPLEVGTVAPDFTLQGGTRYGVLAEPIQLSDFKGKTVVLAFFFRARTKG
jgi:cytochrome oxidase Cu insertion factor (SCO1/SenC/PrrC family)